MTPRCLPWLSLMSALSAPCYAATELIPLGYRTAEEMLSIAQTVVGDQGRVNGHGNQLLVNAPEPVIAELRAVLAELDTPPKRLLISVRSSDRATLNERGFDVQGDVELGGARVGTAGRDGVRIIRRDSDSQGGSVQQVQATEGYPALIQIGQSVPMTEWTTDGYGQVYSDTRYRDLTRGFYATATVVDGRVQVSLSATDERLARGTANVVQSRSTDTRVSGKVGEWLVIGGFDERSNSHTGGFAHRYDTGTSTDYALQLKVEILD